MPWWRMGRSTSTTPWSKSISITRSAITHSRPMETCWNAEMVHSWPNTVLAPISHIPSWTRIFVPCPIHDQRPSRRTASRPIWSFTPGPTKHSPSVCSRAPTRSLSHAQRAISRAYLRFSIPWARRKRRSASGPPWSGAGTPWTPGAAAVLDTVAIAHPTLSSGGHGGGLTGRAAPQRRQARAGTRDLVGRGRRSRGLGAGARGLSAHRQRVRGRVHRPARRGQVHAHQHARAPPTDARPRRGRAVHRPVLALPRR